MATVERSDLQLLQRLRKKRILAMALLLAPLLLIVGSAWPAEGMAAASIEAAGVLLIIVAIFGRTWCTLYIGGRKRASLVADGPYSVMRHPLYAFTVLGLLGLGAQTGSILVAIGLAAFVGWPLMAVARHEEETLLATFGEAWRAYAARTPAFLPRPALWRDVETLEVRPALVRRTFLEAALILLAVPLAEVIHAAQARGLLPVLARLP